jgi:hypothetical protein
MPGKIFINYRRGDEPGYTQALFQRLEAEFGRSQLFMDVEGYIKPGDNFVRVLEEKVAECDILLAIIGPRWIDICDEKQQRRLENKDDFVRIEIVSALEQGKRVIPVLVANARMPSRQELPEPMAPLADLHAVRLSHERFLADCQGLAANLRATASGTDPARGTVNPTDQGDRQSYDGRAPDSQPPLGKASGGKLPQDASAARNPSYLIFAVIFFCLGGLFGWIAWTLGGDPDVTRGVVALLSIVSFFFLFGGIVATRAQMKGRGPQHPAGEQENRSGSPG